MIIIKKKKNCSVPKNQTVHPRKKRLRAICRNTRVALMRKAKGEKEDEEEE